MSETPKTDSKAQFFGFNPDEGEEFVQADFARELERENVALRKEVEEQARLNGKGAERELALRAKVEMLERGNAALRADKERLDWLQNATYWPHPPLGEDIRASIDAAARKEQP